MPSDDQDVIESTPEDSKPREGTEEIREAISTSEGGAPSAGRAVSDIFSTDEIFKRIHVTAQEEFAVPAKLLFLSGLAAGLSMSLSFLGSAVLAAKLPSDPGGLISAFMYPVGFLFVVLGRYQLLTENTLTPVTLVLTRVASVAKLLHIWGIVLVANVLGTGLAALFFAKTGVFDPDTQLAALDIGHHALDKSWGDQFSKGLIAGWLVAGMVWLNHAARSATARFLLVVFLMYLVSAANLAHCIVGSSEVLYLVFEGEANVLDFLWRFLAPVTLGNTVGGVLLVALLNYGQTEDNLVADWEVLSWKQWLLGK